MVIWSWMIDCLNLTGHCLASCFKSKARLEAENIFLRHQLSVLRGPRGGRGGRARRAQVRPNRFAVVRSRQRTSPSTRTGIRPLSS